MSSSLVVYKMNHNPNLKALWLDQEVKNTLHFLQNSVKFLDLKLTYKP